MGAEVPRGEGVRGGGWLATCARIRATGHRPRGVVFLYRNTRAITFAAPQKSGLDRRRSPLPGRSPVVLGQSANLAEVRTNWPDSLALDPRLTWEIGGPDQFSGSGSGSGSGSVQRPRERIKATNRSGASG